MNILSQMVWGILISGVIAFVAYRSRSLSKSGVVGAMIVGTTIFGFGGWVWGALLIVFFVLSSLLSHYKATVKAHLAEKFAKGHQRDLSQTLANGGAGALMAFAFFFYPNPVILAAYIGVIATVNADTWATELGVLSRRHPRLLTTWRPVEPGTSGGISLQGTLASMAGALAIGLAAAIFLAIDGILGGTVNTFLRLEGIPGGVLLVLPAVIGGVIGSLFDSLLGATVQAIYYSPRRQKETERKVDVDGTANVHKRGWRWLTNDWVNFLSSLVGMLVAILVWKTLN